MPNKNRQDRGFSILLILGGIAVLGVVTLLIADLWNKSKANELATLGSFQATAIRNIAWKLVVDKVSWQNTLASGLNPQLACYTAGGDCTAYASNGPTGFVIPFTRTTGNTYSLTLTSAAGAGGGAFQLLKKDSTVYFDATSATTGFTMTGEPCSTFSAGASGNNQCPFHLNLFIRPTGTLNPSHTYSVVGYVVYNPATKNTFSHGYFPYNYSFTVNFDSNGAIYSCCRIGCHHLTGDNSVAYATLSVNSSANCYTGSDEIPNDFCDRALTSFGPAGNSWSPAGAAYNSFTTSSCTQGPPY